MTNANNFFSADFETLRPFALEAGRMVYILATLGQLDTIDTTTDASVVAYVEACASKAFNLPVVALDAIVCTLVVDEVNRGYLDAQARDRCAA